jgi:hypothetical protein
MLAWILKTKAENFAFVRAHGARAPGAHARRRRLGDQHVQHLVDAEVVDRGAEEHRGEFARRENARGRIRARVADQADFFLRVGASAAERSATRGGRGPATSSTARWSRSSAAA